jgi:DNA-binding IclR family transcriptional regulator
MRKPTKKPPTYHAPALEKGLDILEYLAIQRAPLTQIELARALGRGQSEIFRMLTCLERRGYIQKDPAAGTYSTTLRLFELGHAHSPYDQLLRAAARPMREFTERVHESCHLGIIHKGQLLLLAQEERQERVRLSVEVGSLFPLIHSVSGRLMMAYLPESAAEDLWEHDPETRGFSEAKHAAFKKQLQQIRARGFEEAYSETVYGLYDLSVLVGSASSQVHAALTASALTHDAKEARKRLLEPLQACAHSIAKAAGLLI